DERGQQPHYFDIEARERGDDPRDFWAKTYHYCQAHQPLRDQEYATGHAVRACYLYTAIADVALETGDQTLVDVSRRLWDDLTQHQMYITGGLGPAHSNEGFTFAYDLPNETAYAETCASIALVNWAQRMFQIDPHGRYLDVLERALYNTVLAGVSHEGDEFFYANPLTAYPNVNPTQNFTGVAANRHYRRTEWFDCPCCPANASRTVANVGSYFYSTAPNRLYVHLYSPNVAHFDINGSHLHVEQTTSYPWDGSIQISLGLDQPAAFDLALRIPGWCRKFTVAISGAAQTVTPENGYIVLNRTWNNGDTVTLNLDMPVERIAPHPMIRQDVGQVALQRGPLVYCLEEVDNGGLLANIVIPNDAPLSADFDTALFDGVAVIHGDAVRVEPSSWSSEMYQPEAEVEYTRTPFEFTAIPYALWANRAPGEMRVWLRES
ncbi:MAG: beta-L-arabinofuranosidase domain-containing protein, partial [Chloroflexota bacterium]